MPTSKKSIHVIAISEFKAECLALLEEVNKTGNSLGIMSQFPGTG